jgi:5,10-methenyltetrahydromethanopterin hydrogenase
MILAIIEGGWVMKTVVTELSDEEDIKMTDEQRASKVERVKEPDEEATVVFEKKPKGKVEMKKPGGLKIKLDDEDDQAVEEQPVNN